MNTKTASAQIDRTWEESIVPALMEYVRIPNKSPAFDPGLGSARSHGTRGAAHAALGEAARAARHAGRGPSPAGPHAVALDRRPRAGRRHGAAVRSPRQATGVHRLVGGPRALDAGAARRTALRPRRRRRRLRPLRFADRHSRAAGAGHRPRALRDPDRGLRGKRQRRSRAPHRRAGRPHRHRRASSSASTRSAATTISCGARRRCAAISSATCASTC